MNLTFFILNFLYFPEDKSLYIPASIEMGIGIIICIIVFILFKKINKKQIQKTKELEERILRERQANMKEHH